MVRRTRPDGKGRLAHMPPAFLEATRVSTGLLTTLERRCLQWLAARMPSWVSSDLLTATGFLAMAGVGVAYRLSALWPPMLLAVPVCLAVNWFGDSLDGTLARYRRQPRPRYGFYVDHVLDTFGVLFVVGGLFGGGYLSLPVAAAFLIAYYVLLIDVFLATYCLGAFEMSYWRVGPTELRILLAIGSLVLMVHPDATIAGHTYALFDVGGAIAAAGLFLTAVVSAIRHARALYVAEPLPSAPVAPPPRAFRRVPALR